jgi:hypothetical protein
MNPMIKRNEIDFMVAGLIWRRAAAILKNKIARAQPGVTATELPSSPVKRGGRSAAKPQPKERGVYAASMCDEPARHEPKRAACNG